MPLIFLQKDVKKTIPLMVIKYMKKASDPMDSEVAHPDSVRRLLPENLERHRRGRPERIALRTHKLAALRLDQPSISTIRSMDGA